MLRLLETSHFPLTIALGNNAFNPAVENGRFWSGIRMAQAVAFLDTKRMSPGGAAFSDIGVGGDILWHPRLQAPAVESDGVERNTDPTIALAHEMYHAFDSIRGLLDMRSIDGELYEFETRLEYRAVWFENQIRGEMQQRYRRHYSKPLPGRHGKSMLDASELPVYIPAPCL
jgi:hypothetical protein